MSEQPSPEKFTIRRMTVSDLEQVTAIDKMSFTLPWPDRSFRYEVVENQAGRPWVVEVEENGERRVAALAVIWLILDEAHLATIAVHPAYRRRGIAQKLLAEALLSAYEEGARKVFLEVRRGNTAAQVMYSTFGFEVDGVRPRYYADNHEDALLMSIQEMDPQRLTILRDQAAS